MQRTHGRWVHDCLPGLETPDLCVLDNSSRTQCNLASKKKGKTIPQSPNPTRRVAEGCVGVFPFSVATFGPDAVALNTDNH